MGWMELVYLFVMIFLCGLAIKSDLSEGMVYNKTLVVFFVMGIILDVVYYGFILRDMVFPFIVNSLVLMITSLLLFYTHCFAGGDSKLIIVLGLLFPAKCYISYGSSLITLVFAIGIAIFYGYVYLLATSLHSLLKKKSNISGEFIKNYLLMFGRSFLSALIYISAVTLLIRVLACVGTIVPIWITRTICIMCSWLVGRNPVFRKKVLLLVTAVFDVVLAIILKTIPFSIHPENYILVVALLVCQMTIKTSLYEEIQISELKKGLILTMGTTVLMQKSRVRGLPGISSEDLRNRLTENEVESVKRWAKGKKIETVTIVKKIPFATFIALGFISYWIAWGILSWV